MLALSLNSFHGVVFTLLGFAIPPQLACIFNMACLRSNRIPLSFAVALLMVLQTPAGVPVAQGQADCQSQLLKLQPCLPYVIANNSTTPDSACCDPLRSVAASNTSSCFCQLDQYARAGNINVNESRIVEIVEACDVEVPVEVSNCLALGPALAPAPGSASVRIQGSPTCKSRLYLGKQLCLHLSL
ncbi:hypothetical protein GOP47_0027737 [Adiantum capillus-veneris]|nr:hypothetical protein GOP47_0027737 [Adiantum capillus-veneris]